MTLIKMLEFHYNYVCIYRRWKYLRKGVLTGLMGTFEVVAPILSINTDDCQFLRAKSVIL